MRQWVPVNSLDDISLLFIDTATAAAGDDDGIVAMMMMMIMFGEWR